MTVNAAAYGRKKGRSFHLHTAYEIIHVVLVFDFQIGGNAAIDFMLHRYIMHHAAQGNNEPQLLCSPPAFVETHQGAKISPGLLLQVIPPGRGNDRHAPCLQKSHIAYNDLPAHPQRLRQLRASYPFSLFQNV